MMKKVKLVAILAVLALLFTGCKTTTSTSTANSSKTDLSNVTIRVAETGWGSLEGALKASGLDNTPYKVEYSIFQGGNLCLQAMAAGQIDFTTSSETPPLFAAQASNGGNFKIIAISSANTLLQELVIPKGSNIKTIADLKGKKVGYINATTAQYFLLKMLQKAGLSWSDINAEQMTTADGVTALIGGKIDAFASYGNSITAAHQNGATTLASAEDILSGNFPYEATPAAINDPAKHAAILDYLTRLEKADEWELKNVDKWAQLSAQPQGQTVDQATTVLTNGNNERPTHVKPVSQAAITSEQSVSDAFFSVGLIKSKFTVNSIYSDAFTNELKKEFPTE